MDEQNHADASLRGEQPQTPLPPPPPQGASNKSMLIFGGLALFAALAVVLVYSLLRTSDTNSVTANFIYSKIGTATSSEFGEGGGGCTDCYTIGFSQPLPAPAPMHIECGGTMPAADVGTPTCGETFIVPQGATSYPFSIQMKPSDGICQGDRVLELKLVCEGVCVAGTPSVNTVTIHDSPECSVAYDPEQQAKEDMEALAQMDPELAAETAAGPPAKTIDDFPGLTVKFASTTVRTSEGHVGTVMFVLSSPAPEPLRVPYTISGTLSEDEMYRSTEGSVNFSKGQTTDSFDILPFVDCVPEGEETFDVTVTQHGIKTTGHVLVSDVNASKLPLSVKKTAEHDLTIAAPEGTNVFMLSYLEIGGKTPQYSIMREGKECLNPEVYGSNGAGIGDAITCNMVDPIVENKPVATTLTYKTPLGGTCTWTVR